MGPSAVRSTVAGAKTGEVAAERNGLAAETARAVIEGAPRGGAPHEGAPLEGAAHGITKSTGGWVYSTPAH